MNGNNSYSQLIQDLKKELKRFSGFMNPEPIKSRCSDAIDFLSYSKKPFPISNSDNKIILAIVSIFENKKILKISSSIVNLTIQLLQNELIQSNALALIIRKIEESLTDFEVDSLLKLIQYATVAIPSHYLDLPLFQFFLYVCLLFSDHTNELLHTTAFAASNQIILSFFNFAKNSTSRESITPEQQRSIDLSLISTFKSDSAIHDSDSNSKTTQNKPPKQNSNEKNVKFGNTLKHTNSSSSLFDISYIDISQIDFSSFASIDKVAFILLYDLVYLAIGNRPKWLHINPSMIKTKTVYSLLTNLLVEHHDYLSKDKRFLELVSLSFSFVQIKNAPLSFIVPVFGLYLDSIPQICFKLFSDFIEDLDPSSHSFVRSLIFFRSIIIGPPEIISKIIPLDTTSIFPKLVLSLRIAAEQTIHETFSLSINPIPLKSMKNKSKSNINSTNSNLATKRTSSHGDLLQYKDDNSNVDEMKSFKAGTPVEIIAFITQACYASTINSVRMLMTKMWPDILGVLSLALEYVQNESCCIIMQALHSLLELSQELKLERARSSVIASLCSLLYIPKESTVDPQMNKEMLMKIGKEIPRAAYDTVSTAIQLSPACFHDHWGKILDSLSYWNWIPSSFDFTRNMSDAEILEFVLTLISARQKQWALDLLVDTLKANDERFELLWKAVDGYFCLLIDDPEYELPALSAFLSLLHKNITPNTEGPLCHTLESFFCGRKRLATQPRARILEEVSLMLSQKGTVLKNGWTYLLNTLLPENFRDESDILNSSFRCIQIICNDLMFALPEDTQEQCVKVFFLFVSQMTDINVSLSAFGLMWNVVSIAKTAKMWMLIFKHAAECIRDPRNDVALCAVRTFFSLISSNFQHFPSECFHYLINECLIPLLDFLSPVQDSEISVDMLSNNILNTISNSNNNENNDNENNNSNNNNTTGNIVKIIEVKADGREMTEKEQIEEFINSYSGSGDKEATQQLAFHELAHCGKILWSKFEDEPAFNKLWTNLLIEHELFMEVCIKREILYASFQFYEEVFLIPQFNQEQKDILFKTFDRLVEYFLAKEGENSTVFSQFGKVIRAILPEQSPDRSKDEEFLPQLQCWLNIIKKLIVRIDSGDLPPPTAHKSLDAIELLLPRSEKITKLLYEELVNYAIMPGKHLEIMAIEHLNNIIRMKQSQEMIPTLFMLSCPILNLPEARSLLLFFIEYDISFADEAIPSIFSSLIELGETQYLLRCQKVFSNNHNQNTTTTNTNSSNNKNKYSKNINNEKKQEENPDDIPEKVGIALIKLFPKLTIEEKGKLAAANLGVTVTLEFWKRFIDPRSTDFNKDDAKICSKCVIHNVKNLLQQANEEELKEILKFLAEAESDSEALECKSDGQKRHIYLLLTNLAAFIFHPNDEIKKYVKDLIIQLGNEPI